MPFPAPSLRSLSKLVVNYGSTAVAVPKPAGLAKHDVMLAAALSMGPFGLPSGFASLLTQGIPGGWTGGDLLPAGSAPWNADFTDPILSVSWKEAGDADVAANSFSFQGAGTQPWAVILAAYRDVGAVQSGSHRYNWVPDYWGDPSLGKVVCNPVSDHGFPDVETLYDNCLVVGILGSGPGMQPSGGPLEPPDWLTQGLTFRGSQQVWPGTNPLLALFDGLQALTGVRSGMVTSCGMATSTCYSLVLVPRMATTVHGSARAFQQGLLTDSGDLQTDAATPQTVHSQAQFGDRLSTDNQQILGVDGELGSTRVTLTWTREGILA